MFLLIVFAQHWKLLNSIIFYMSSLNQIKNIGSEKPVYFYCYNKIYIYILNEYNFFLYKIKKKIDILNIFSLCYTLIDLFIIFSLEKIFQYLRDKVDHRFEEILISIHYFIVSSLQNYQAILGSLVKERK